VPGGASGVLLKSKAPLSCALAVISQFFYIADGFKLNVLVDICQYIKILTFIVLHPYPCTEIVVNAVWPSPL
jgi:hypothetical protein